MVGVSSSSLLSKTELLCINKQFIIINNKLHCISNGTLQMIVIHPGKKLFYLPRKKDTFYDIEMA